MADSASSSSFLRLLPDCMAAGDGQGAAYILPSLVQIAPNLMRDGDDDDALGEHQHVAEERAIFLSALEYGLLAAVDAGIDLLDTLHGARSDSQVILYGDAESAILSARNTIAAWSDVVTDLSWSALASAVPTSLVHVIQRVKERTNISVGAYDDASGSGVDSVLVDAMVGDIRDVLELVQAFLYL